MASQDKLDKQREEHFKRIRGRFGENQLYKTMEPWTLYVKRGGKHLAMGSQEDPFAEIQAALVALPPTIRHTCKLIVMDSDVYEPISIKHRVEAGGSLTIESAEGEQATVKSKKYTVASVHSGWQKVDEEAGNLTLRGLKLDASESHFFAIRVTGDEPVLDQIEILPGEGDLLLEEEETEEETQEILLN